MSHPIPDKLILSLGKELFREHGPNLTFQQFASLTRISKSTIVNHFGGWLPFKKRLGLKPVAAPNATIAPGHTADALLRKLKQFAKANGPDVRLREFAAFAGVSQSLIYQRFGSWTKLRQQAGLVAINRSRDRITNHSLVADMLRISLEKQRAITRRLYKRHGLVSLATILNRFGDWRTALLAQHVFTRQLNDKYPRRDALIAQLHKHLLPLLQKSNRLHRQAPPESPDQFPWNQPTPPPKTVYESAFH